MARVTATEQAATRRRLLEAGKREFAERGLAGARFDDISLAAGHAKGTIYNYFESKDALFFAIVEEWCTLVVAAIDTDRTGTARDRLLAVASLDVDIARKDPDLARVVVQQVPALLITHWADVAASIAPGVELLEAVFEDGLRSGEFVSPHPAQALARLFLATLSAFELEALMPDPAISLDVVVELVDHHFVNGLAMRPEDPSET